MPPQQLEPNVLLNEDEAMELSLQVEGMVCEFLEAKAKAQGKDFSGMTDSVPGIRAVVNALIRNYL